MNELISTRIRDHATRLALPHLAENFDGLLDRAQADTMGYLEFVDLLLGEEVGLREGRRIRTALKLSGLPHHEGLDALRLRLPTRARPAQDPRPRRAGVRHRPRQHRPARPTRGREDPPRRRPRRRGLLRWLLDLLTSIDEAVRQLRAAKQAGRVAKKLQTYLRSAVLVLDEVGCAP